MQEVRILHVASFKGNVGDNASHSGLYSILNEIIGSYQVEQLEMRKFYLNYRAPDKRVFDESFIDYANGFDLIIFGGGGFLDYWVPGSPTGTTISIEPRLLEQLKPLTLITSMGSLPKKEIPEGNIEKYKLFLDKIFEHDNIKIAVRNDGSKKAIERDLGEEYAKRIDEVLDSGFFYVANDTFPKLADDKYIAINVGADQVQLLAGSSPDFSESQFYNEIQSLIFSIIHDFGMHVILVPHVYGDITAINTILAKLNDSDLRNNVSVGPCVQGEGGADLIFSIYKNSHAVIASRLHANICSLAINRNVIGLPVLERVSSIHKSFGSEQFVSVFGDFSNEVLDKIKGSEIEDSVLKKIKNKKHETFNFYRNNLSNIV